MERGRISVIGIDGSGKSSTTLKAIYSLSHYILICRIGRSPFSIWKGDISRCLPKMANFFESLFKTVDATKKRQWIGLTRLLFVFFQGWLEPHMINKYCPELVMATRCMIIDSAIYSDFYYLWICRRMTIESKLRFAQQYSRLPFRDLYFFLDTPIETAMERIYKRISGDHPKITYGRDYWLHLHEHEGALGELDQKFRKTLKVAQEIKAFKIVEIETAKHSEEQVSNPLELTPVKEVTKKSETRTGNSPAMGVTKDPAPIPSYNLIAQRNIFNPERKDFPVTGSGTSTKPVARPQVVLYGVTIAGDYQSASVVNPGRPLKKGEREQMTIRPGERI